MQVFLIDDRIDEKVDPVRPAAVTPQGSAEQVSEGAPGSANGGRTHPSRPDVSPDDNRMAREISMENGH